MRRTVVIGDVHGCVDELRALLRECQLGPEDQVVLVGDLVAKGPDSQAVVQFARERGFLAVLGNHDAHVLQARAGTLSSRPKPAHQQVVDSLREADWAYLEALPTWRALPELGVVVVHAGLVPGVPPERQEREHLLNLRSIRPDGTPSKRVEDGAPWASLWSGPQHVVFGHDALRGLQQHPFASGLDTGCVYGGRLTALILPERRWVSVQAHRAWARPGA